MRITSSVEARLYMDMLRISSSNKSRKTERKLFDGIKMGNIDTKVSQVTRSNGTSPNRRIDEEINLQSYINKAKETNEKTIENAGDKITAQNSYVSETDACYNAIHDKYTKLLEEAKTHSNPNAYIQDKYCNINSPYYVSDLTDEEREIAYSNEVTMLNYGCMNDCSMHDSLFRGISIYNEDEVENQKSFNRQVVNSEMNNLFKEKGINVPEGTQLTFSIDPYSYKLTVGGIEDEGLRERVEKVLNSGDNAKGLYSHIISSSSGSDLLKSTQFTREGLEKRSLYNEVMTVTGIDIRSLNEKNGGYYTQDGQNIIDIFNSKLEDMAQSGKPHVPIKYTGACEEYVAGMVKEIATKGWDNINDMVLSISYKDNKLQDMYQNINYSESNENRVYKYGRNSFNTLP